MLMLQSHAEEKVNTSEVYALAVNPKFLPTRRKKTCGDLLPGVFLTSNPSSSTGPKEFGRAECDAQILVSLLLIHPCLSTPLILRSPTILLIVGDRG